MVDAVDTEVLFSGTRKYAVRLTNLSDGTGETTVTKVDRSALVGPDGVNAPNKIVIERIDYDVQGFASVALYWDGSPDEPIAVLTGQNILDYSDVGGLVPDTAGAGTAGDIILTTEGTAALDDTYTITLRCRLKGSSTS